jgi:thiol-disulfide isomerase/thioredoxin
MKKIKVFGNPNCTKCRKMSPILKEIFDEGINIEFFMEEGNEQLFFDEEIEGFPTIKFYKDEIFYGKFVGIVTKKEIVKKYKEL